MNKLIIILFLFPLFAFTQNIEGIVLNKKDNLPIQDANIIFNQNNESTATDESGKFKLIITGEFRQSDSLYISHIGYATKKISLFEFKKNNYQIFLHAEIEYLDNLTITLTNKELKPKLDYTKLAPLKYAISSFGSILNDNKIYVIGGDSSSKTDVLKKLQYQKPDFSIADFTRELNSTFSGQLYKGNLLIYDIKTNVWETSIIKFRKRAYNNLNVYDNNLYVLGGKRVSTNGKFEYLDDKIEVLDLNKETVAIDNTNPHQASKFASFTYNSTIITIGGSTKMNENKSKSYSDKVHSYDTKTGYWYELTKMPTPKEVNGILINDKIYLIGGFNEKPMSTIESFDIPTETWKTEGELLNSLDYPAITNKNDIIYFFENGKICTYDINAKSLKEYLINLPLKSSKLFYSDEKLYLLGGYLENNYSQLPSLNLYSIDLDEFEKTKPNRIKTL